MARLSSEDRTEREAYWRGQIAACEASGESIVRYCRGAGIALSKYHWWKGELKRRDGSCSVMPVFAEVRVHAPLRIGSGSGSGIEVALAGGRVVRVERGFDAATLAEVVAVLEAVGVRESSGC